MLAPASHCGGRVAAQPLSVRWLTPFSTEIQLVGVNPYVRPPDAVLRAVFRRAGTDKGPIAVRGTVNGARFQQSLVRYAGDWRLYINGKIAKAAGLTYRGSISAIAGRQVIVTLALDRAPPTYPVPAPFMRALRADRKAKSAFERLTPGRQKEIVRYLGSLKSAAVLARNIERVRRHLRGEPADALGALMSPRRRAGSQP